MHICKPLNFKFAPGVEGRFRGIASSFSSTPDRQGDIIVPGAYARSLTAWSARDARIPLLWMHNPGEPIGAILEAEESAQGLEVEGQLADDSGVADRAYRLLQTGGLSMSIGFDIDPSAIRIRSDGARELRSIDLVEISLVSVPADPLAVVTQVKAGIRSFEAVARDVLGLSGREAKRLAAGGYAALVREEPAEADPHAQTVIAALSRIASTRI